MDLIPHLIRPLWLGLPMLLTLAWAVQTRLRQRQSNWGDYVDPVLHHQVLEPTKATSRRPWAALLPVWLCGFAAAGPSWQQAPQALYVNEDPLCIALDLSQSMLVADLPPNRLERAKFKLADLLSEREGGLTALIAYTSAAFVVTPLTNDTTTIRQQLSVLSPRLMPTQGTRIAEAHALCGDLLRQSGHQNGSLLLLGDDIDEASLVRLAAEAQTLPLKIFMLGIGTPAGGPVPDLPAAALTQGPSIARVDHHALSQRLASLGGDYLAVRDDQQDIKQLVRTLARNQATPGVGDARGESLAWQDSGPYLLLLCLPWIAHWAQRYLLGLTLLTFTFTLAPIQQARADDYWWLWETEEQHAQRLLDAGDAAAALAHFRDRERRAHASYLAGKPGDTSQLLEGLQDARSLYNRGTALARERRLPEALEVLEAALKADPHNQDARLNRDAVKRALEQQTPKAGESADTPSGPADGAEPQDPAQAGSPDEGKAADPRAAESSDAQTATEPPAEQDQANATPTDPPKTAEDEPPEAPQPNEAKGEAQEDEEVDQATEQWLRRIPDDPGGLLRNKFLYQYRRREHPSEDQDPSW